MESGRVLVVLGWLGMGTLRVSFHSGWPGLVDFDVGPGCAGLGSNCYGLHRVVLGQAASDSRFFRLQSAAVTGQAIVGLSRVAFTPVWKSC